MIRGAGIIAPPRRSLLGCDAARVSEGQFAMPAKESLAPLMAWLDRRLNLPL